MTTCKYKYKNKNYSYQELVEQVSQELQDPKNRSKYAHINDEVFSKTIQEEQLDRIIDASRSVTAQLKREKSIDTSSLLSGNSEYNDGRHISLASAINNPLVQVNGRPIYNQMSVEDYFKIETDYLIQRRDLEESEKDAYIEKIKNNWKNIEDDGYLIKYILGSFNLRESTNDLVQKLINDPEIKANSRIYNTNILTSIIDQLKSSLNYIQGNRGDRKLLKNINVIAKVDRIAKEVLGHIDYLTIEDDGSIKIYCYKTSYQKFAQWTKEKKQHYKLSMAFLQRMLWANGIKADKISSYVIPIEMNYSDDFQNIEGVRVGSIWDMNQNYSGQYTMNKANDIARTLITEQKKTPKIYPAEEAAERVNYIMNTLFPGLNITSEGCKKSAKQWIKEAPESGEENQLTIKHDPTKDHEYIVTINGVQTEIKNKNSPENNPQIIKLVTDHIQELQDNLSYSTQSLKEAIKGAYKHGQEQLLRYKGLRYSMAFLGSTFRQYFKFELDENREKQYEWEMMEDFLNYNIIGFRNKKTKQVDLISLSAFDVDQTMTMRNGQKNILGFHKYDVEMPGQWRADYGNYEAVRAMSVLNELIGNYDPQDYKFATLKVISSFNGGKGRQFNIKLANDQQFNEILKVAKLKGQDIDIQNNLSEEHFMDPIDAVLELFDFIMENSSQYRQEELEKLGIYNLADAKTKEEKITTLRQILEMMQREYFQNSSREDIKQSSRVLGRIGTLYELVVHAYQYHTGVMPRVDQDLGSGMRRWMSTTTHMPQDNVQYVVHGYITAVNEAAAELQDFANKHIIPIVKDYHKVMGYSAAENLLVGDQLRALYWQLYEVDIDGKRMLKFKNPYINLGDSNYLSNHQREFLKKALYVFQLIRTQGNFKIQYGSKELENFVHQHGEYYLQVPLIRAGGATKAQTFRGIRNAIKTAKRAFTDTEHWFNEAIEHLSPEEAQQYEEDFSRMNLRNPFDIGEISIENDNLQRRQKYIQDRGVDYFETNVEDLMLFYASKSISTQKMNDFLVGIKSFLLELEMMGENGSNSKNVKDSYKYITDFLKVNVFKRSIEDTRGQKIMAALSPIRSLVRFMNLAFNIKGSIRDLIQGGTEGFIRTVTKYNSDISAKSLSKAHAYVMTHLAGSNASHTNLLSAMCTKYRLSNVDMASVETRLRSGRAGLFNINEAAYYTLKSPDFYNRMTLFVAKLIEDGVWDAVSFKDGKMVYNWREDKRFSVYASGNTNHPDYAKQRGLYYSYIRMHNQEHPENKLEYSDDLKEPYTDGEILSIRGFADNIFGSYDKATKGMMEHVSWGSVFGQYTTWMNGIFNNYFARPGSYKTSLRKLKQQTDDNGNPLFFREDGSMTIEETNSPVVDSVPVPTQGIVYTLGGIGEILLKSDNKWKDTIEYCKMEQNGQNLKKLLSDFIMMIIYAALVRGLWGAQYKEKKKHMVDDSMVSNAIAEILYKSTESSFDSYLGPLAIIDRWGSQANPPMYTVPIKNLTTLWKAATNSDVGIIDYLSTNMSVMRAFRDTYQAEKRKNKEQ